MSRDSENRPAEDLPAAETARPGAWLLAVCAVVVLVVAGAGYAWKGAPFANPQGADGPPAGFAEQAATPEEAASAAAAFAVMVDRLAERLKDKPDDVVGFTMLARSYLMLGRYDDSVSTYQKVLKLKPDDATVLVDYAEAVAMKNGRSLDGEPMTLIERALKLDPNHLKGLSIAGAAAFNQGDYAGAVARWDRVVAVGPADDPLVQNARESAVEARQVGKLPPAAPLAAAPVTTPAPGTVPGASPGGPATAPAATVAAAITGTVTLAPALKAQVSPTDTVFVFARAAEGSRMPLAILRKQVQDLPLEFRLDDSLAMSPATRLSSAQRVVVGARISKSGQAMPQPGDFEGLSAPVATDATALRIEIASPVR